ncbi:MAG: DUF1800 family protein [Bacteroidota bacterium]
MPSLLPVSGTLGRKRAAHLLRRVAFGCNREQIEAFANKSVMQAVEDLLTPNSLLAPHADASNGVTWMPDGSIAAPETKIIAWWMYHALDPSKPPTIFPRLSFFLHTCLTIKYDLVPRTHLYYYLRLLMEYTDKSYKTLVRKMTVDNGMGLFLNISDSTKDHPNENYARELLELFTVGKGPQIGPGDYTNYTEGDILEAARILTGFITNWDYNDVSKYDPDLGWAVMFPYPPHHDPTNKSFSAAFGNRTIQGRADKAGMLQEVDDLIDMIFDQEAVSLFIIRKLYRYFVHYEITAEIESDIILPLAETFRNNGFHFMPVLSQLLNSSHFFDEDDAVVGDHVIGGLIKSPLDLWYSTVKGFGANIPDPNVDLASLQSWLHYYQIYSPEMGMILFNPSSVAGYDPMYQEPEFNRYWINQSTLPSRYGLIYQWLLDHNMHSAPAAGRFNALYFAENPAYIPPYYGFDPQGNPGPHDGARIADHLVRNIVDYLLPVELSQDRFMYFRDEVLLDSLSPVSWMMEWDNYKASGNPTNVQSQLTKLVKAVIQSPEFQLY